MNNLNIDVDTDTDIVDSGRLMTCAGQTPEPAGWKPPPFPSIFGVQIMRAGAWQVQLRTSRGSTEQMERHTQVDARTTWSSRSRQLLLHLLLVMT